MSATRIAVRCDGGDRIGAGHVGRCIPVAQALYRRGADVAFVGSFDGVARTLLERSGVLMNPPQNGPCGLAAAQWSAALVDLYLDGAQEVCELTRELPVATLGEASRCPDAGIWIDYHLGSPPESSEHRLGGPAYIPTDPRLARIAQPADTVRTVLVAAGASARLAPTAAKLAGAVAEAFPQARILAPAQVAARATCDVDALPQTFDLGVVAREIDLAVTAAGMTSYELMSAGVPVIAVGLVENQRVVIDGCSATGAAVPVNGIDDDPLPHLRIALARLADTSERAVLAATGARLVDGGGAERIAAALLGAWRRPGETEPGG